MGKARVFFNSKLAANLLLFTVFILIGGLLQAWILVLDSSFDEPELYFSELFADGSLFFFSFSLACGAMFTIRTKPELFGGKDWLNHLVEFCFLAIFFFAMFFYIPDAKEFLKEDLAPKHTMLMKPDTVIQMHAPNVSHLGRYFWAQVACVTLALLIGLLIAAKDFLVSTRGSQTINFSGQGLVPNRMNGKPEVDEAATSAHQRSE
jgi:hypothetical protein